jgi:hypothetical protein
MTFVYSTPPQLQWILTIYLDDHRTRAANLISKLQHLAAGVPLVYIGGQKLLNNTDERLIAILELVIGLAVGVAFLQELRATLRPSETSHPRFGWFELAAGILLVFEAFHGATTKPGYLRPAFLAGTATIGLGLFHHRLQARAKRRRYLKLDDAGLELQSNRFRWYKLKWAELDAIAVSESKIVFQKKNGRTRSIRLLLFRNAEEIRTAILEHPACAKFLSSSVIPPPAVESSTPPAHP